MKISPVGKLFGVAFLAETFGCRGVALTISWFLLMTAIVLGGLIILGIML